MIENKDHFKFFIEDDKNFDDYIADMSKDGTWGGNLEIYAMSMHFNVNFYIHIYNHPMYIVKNWDFPSRNIQLSYHDGEHYNSVRLSDDFTEDIPIDIPLEMINCVEQSTDFESRDSELPDENNSSGEEEKSETMEKPIKNNTIEEESKQIQEGDDTFIVLNGTIIKDIKDKDKQNYKKCIISSEGIILEEVGDNKKCHCSSNKKYKNCCVKNDIKGQYNKSDNIFYCDLHLFKSNQKYEIKSTKEKDEKSEKENGEVGSITKKMERIFI
jgi:OTU domain-containing protein 3